MRAASSYSVGIDLKFWRIRKVPKIEVAWGMIRPGNELPQPKVDTTMYSGMIVTVLGIISVPIKTQKMRSRATNLPRAKANPDMEQVNSCMRVILAVITTLFKTQRPINDR